MISTQPLYFFGLPVLTTIAGIPSPFFWPVFIFILFLVTTILLVRSFYSHTEANSHLVETPSETSTKTTDADIQKQLVDQNELTPPADTSTKPCGDNGLCDAMDDSLRDAYLERLERTHDVLLNFAAWEEYNSEKDVVRVRLNVYPDGQVKVRTIPIDKPKLGFWEDVGTRRDHANFLQEYGTAITNFTEWRSTRYWTHLKGPSKPLSDEGVSKKIAERDQKRAEDMAERKLLEELEAMENDLHDTSSVNDTYEVKADSATVPNKDNLPDFFKWSIDLHQARVRGNKKVQSVAGTEASSNTGVENGPIGVKVEGVGPTSIPNLSPNDPIQESKVQGTTVNPPGIMEETGQKEQKNSVFELDCPLEEYDLTNLWLSCFESNGEGDVIVVIATIVFSVVALCFWQVWKLFKRTWYKEVHSK